MNNFENFLKLSLKIKEFDFGDSHFVNAGSFGSVFKVLHKPSKLYSA